MIGPYEASSVFSICLRRIGVIEIRCLATFETTYMALKFERSCRDSGIDARIIPMPREISSDCGFACGFSCDLMDKINDIVREHGIDRVKFHEIAGV